MTLQAEFGDDSLAEFGMWGMWEDVRASIARLVAAGPPAEEVAPPQDEVARVAHGFGQTCGFCRAGPTGMGPVSDLPTCANTVPVTGNPRVSATRSHHLTHIW